MDTSISMDGVDSRSASETAALRADPDGSGTGSVVLGGAGGPMGVADGEPVCVVDGGPGGVEDVGPGGVVDGDEVWTGLGRFDDLALVLVLEADGVSDFSRWCL